MLHPQSEHFPYFLKTTAHKMLAPLIHVVDDDEGIRESIVSLLESYGWTVHAHKSAEDFLAHRRDMGPACLILDIRMPGSNGLDLQSELRRLGDELAIVFLTGHGTIPLTVRAMREGAIEFLTKPFTEVELIRAVNLALKSDYNRWEARQELHNLQVRLDSLTSREREVFSLVVSGNMNKVIGGILGITEATVKVHRRHVMEKFSTEKITELVRIAALLGIDSANTSST